MKIQCLPRKWFEEIKGTVREMEVLAQSKVVSIQSRSGWDSEPPFSEEGLKSPNLLCLTFDDVTDYSDLYDGEKVARFRPVMAQKILKHVGHGRLKRRTCLKRERRCDLAQDGLCEPSAPCRRSARCPHVMKAPNARRY